MPTLCQTTAVRISPFAAESARSPEDPAHPIWLLRFEEMLKAALQLGLEEKSVNQSINAPQFQIHKWLSAVKRHLIYPSFLSWIASTEIYSAAVHSAQIISHLECICCTRGLCMQGGCSWTFRVSQSTVSASTPPRTAGNTKHSCYVRYNLFFHFEIWAGKKVRTLAIFLECLEIASVYLWISILTCG